LYDGKHSFVWKLGASVIELLAPQFGERILDVGCGTGQLTAQIAESGATVIGLDSSPAMIDRPTPLEGDNGLRNWVRMFGQHWLSRIPSVQHDAFFQQIEEIAHPNLHRDSVWFADYRRIRLVARKS